MTWQPQQQCLEDSTLHQHFSQILNFCHYENFEYVSPLYHVRLGICIGNIDEVTLQTLVKILELI
uniref:Uncharacterized protein n=1 Tax=Bos indicus x Bos taurus TaxID=30522 RepID=A0A4W2FDW0_BOBOX